jgi:agmatinase
MTEDPLRDPTAGFIHYPDGTIGPADGQVSPRYTGIATFGRLPQLRDVPHYDIAVVGVPFDSGVSYRPGARFGPAAIRQGSRLLRPYNPAQDALPFRDAQVVDAGDIVCTPFDIDRALGEITAGLGRLIGDGKRVVTLGGDHTIALPALRAFAAVHGPLALVHFDAHLDTWDTYFDAPYTHGTPFRRASEEGLIVKGNSAHVGIRGPLYDRSDLSDDDALGFTIVHCRDMDELGVAGAVAAVRRRVGSHPVYVSVDIDVLDPAFAPATGTPEAGGLTSRELLGILRGFTGLNLVGADIVEVAPAYDHAEITSIAAAHVAYEIVTMMASGKPG